MKELGGRRKKIRDDSPQHRLAQPQLPQLRRLHADAKNSSTRAAQLIEMAEQSRTAYMCAERVYFQCHRMLVSDWLVAHGHEVLHIDGTGPAKPHKLLPKRV